MKRAIRIFAGVGAIALIIFILMVTMAFTGNPISKILATRAADKHVEENYSHLELSRDETVFDFKRGSYIVYYYQEGSKDIHFGIETDYLGRIFLDGYETNVLGKWNTVHRLSDEFDKYVERIIRQNLGYDYFMILGDIIGPARVEEISALEIDMNFDIDNLPLEKYLTVYIYQEDRTWEKLAQIMLEIDEVMEEHGIYIDYYSVILQEKMDDDSLVGESIEAYDFPKKNLDSNDLVKTLEDFAE